MKKLLIVMFTLFSTIGFISCGNQKKTAVVEEDTVSVDTLEVAEDSIPTDSL